MATNVVRGEAELVLAGSSYRLEATMDALARLASAVGDPPISDLYRRLVGPSLDTCRQALAMFVQGGTAADGRRLNRREAADAILCDLTLTDMAAVGATMATLLLALTRPDGDASRGNETGNQIAAPG